MPTQAQTHTAATTLPINNHRGMRQRRPTPPVETNADSGAAATDGIMRERRSGLSAPVLLDSTPQHHGPVMKLHTPQLYSILPEFLKRWIRSISFLRFLCPSWKQRYIILCGAFLYKFSSTTSKEPKGSPFEIRSVEVSGASIDHVDGASQLGPGYGAIVTVSTLRRQHVYAVANKQEAQLWIRSIEEAKQAAITHQMGHANHIPYPTRWKHLDALGSNLVKSKERIKERMESSQLREMETSSFADGGPLPRGFHG
eukprot:CAMPEP_0119546920 /NCGR_PEP_ID=MMETSP1352-20130426/1154_1 /TAXON_ID=265584 /ORGANISM="Stauroneis constricta, Strain CCMP1120" /LENGTH=255 /DNA_ID=CAMNT_0007591687 /DNA_START=27 /DNA_END=794 /DNA_ORIENTATION=+